MPAFEAKLERSKRDRWGVRESHRIVTRPHPGIFHSWIAFIYETRAGGSFEGIEGVVYGTSESRVLKKARRWIDRRCKTLAREADLRAQEKSYGVGRCPTRQENGD